MLRVQIAGIKTVDQALMAVQANADAVGLVVGVTHESGDEIDPQTAKEIFLKLPPFVCKTLITHYTDEQEIINYIDYIKPTAVQLHSIDICVDTIARLKAKYQHIKFIGVVHANLPNAIDRAVELAKVSDAIFTDTKTDNRLGGTGVTHDWHISAKINSIIGKPLILAGGLNADNLEEAVSIVNPYGVDVNTGVKRYGEFSQREMSLFVSIAKSISIFKVFSGRENG